MALDLDGLKTNLKAVFDNTLVDAGSDELNEENFINGLAEAIQTFVLTAALTYGGGLVAGSAPVTGDIIGGLE